MHDTEFFQRSVIVTGAGQGIGKAIAAAIASRGGFVLLNDVESSLAEEASRSIRAAGGVCHPFAGDCSRQRVIQEMVQEAISRFGKLDAVVANAGITLFGDFLDYQPQDFMKVMEVNLAGSFFLAQAAARQMIQQNSGGSILFMSSVTGHQAHKNLAAYGMSKAALEMLAKHLVVELSPHRINVNAIAPGATMTERTSLDAGYESTWSKITPMGRPARVEDIAHAAMFLISPAATHITGQALVIDGGWTSVSPSPY